MTEEAKKIAKSMHFEECEDCAFNPTRLGCRWRREGKYCDTNLHLYADLIESLCAELERVTRERDAAVEDLEILSDCETCLHNNDEACEHCCDIIVRGNWQWRGAKE